MRFFYRCFNASLRTKTRTQLKLISGSFLESGAALSLPSRSCFVSNWKPKQQTWNLTPAEAPYFHFYLSPFCHLRALCAMTCWKRKRGKKKKNLLWWRKALCGCHFWAELHSWKLSLWSDGVFFLAGKVPEWVKSPGKIEGGSREKSWKNSLCLVFFGLHKKAGTTPKVT